METEYFKNKILPLKNKIFRKALCITESTEEAADVVQEVMMRIWEKREEWDLIQNMEVYCMVLTKNIALDMIKKSGYRNDSIHSETMQAIPSDEIQPFDETVREDEKKWLWKLIRSLPDIQQEVIQLREFEELSYQEIAEKLNLTESQVKTNLFRARQKLRELYLKIENYGL
jgi:RNA polymerase sigma-70 factor (ECF subfamily)